MKVIQLTILILISTIFSYSQSNSWNGITPLHSTRTDVEKILGKPKECRYGYCEYVTDKERVVFTYIDNRCERGWNVPKDTVSDIDIKQKDLVGMSDSELNLDKSKFKIISVNDIFHTRWLNAEEGVSYHFNAERIFNGKTFHPKKIDNNLRCNGFPPYAPEEEYYSGGSTPRLYDPKDTSSDVFLSVIAGFDETIHAARINNSKALAYVYFDNKLSIKEYRMRVKRIKDFLIKKRKYPLNQINIIEGGLREKSVVVFRVVRQGEKLPTPTPTLPSPQFMNNQ